MKNRVLRRTTWTVLFTLLGTWLPVAPVHAALIDSAQIITSSQSVHNRERIRDFLQRADVRALLQKQGVDANAALLRVNAMTDDEVQTVANQLDQLPAGGDVLGLLFTVFVILLVTDILGFTKVFPFTRPIR